MKDRERQQAPNIAENLGISLEDAYYLEEVNLPPSLIPIFSKNGGSDMQAGKEKIMHHHQRRQRDKWTKHRTKFRKNW